MSKGENIVKWIKGQRISWLGHLERMEEDRMPKKIFTQEFEGTRRRGRPRKRWKEEVERDLQVLGVRSWRELVADREKNGRTLFDRPKPTVGCSANGRRSDKIRDVYISDLVNWASKMEGKQEYARFFKNKPSKWCSICTSEMLLLSGDWQECVRILYPT